MSRQRSTLASIFLANLYSALALALLFIQYPLTADAALMKCPECHPDKCGAPPDNCPLGLVWDSCDCCLICGKTEGEFCGGKINHYGRCGQGLKCYTSSAYSIFGMCVVDTSSPPSFQETKALKASKRDQFKKEDTVKIAASEMLVLPSKYKYDETYKMLKTTEMPPPQMDDPSASYMSKKEKHLLDKCEPECTVEFCSENPRALCSAYRQADTNSCKDPCATTVCRACETRFDPSLSCVYCPYGQKSIEKKKYIDCIKEFGRCVKKGLNGKGPDIFSMKNPESSFYCAVPTCKP